MKIAIYHNLLSGGAKRALHEVTRRLATRHHLDVFSLSTAEHDFGDLRPHVGRHEVTPFRPLPLLASPLGRLNQLARWADLVRLRGVTRSIAGQIEQDGYDVVFVHPCRYENSPSLLTSLNRLPSVYFCQEPLRRLYEPMPSRPYDQMESGRRRLLNQVDPLPRVYHRSLRAADRRNLRRANVVLVNSEFVRTAVQSIYQVDPRVSYLGVDTDLFRPLARQKGPVILSVGSLTPLKGFDFLIRAVGRIPSARRPALWIASNFEQPMERDYLASLASQHGVDLSMLSRISDDRLVELYNEAVLTAYAPIREPFGLVALESLACGTPLVAVRDGGVPETVTHGVVGLLVERDEDQFAQATQRLLAEPVLRSEFGRRGRSWAERQWSWDRATERIESHLIEAARLG